MTDLVGHILLFSIAMIGFLMVPLLIGRLVRPKLPTPEKDAIYECGEPTIGSSYVQFDLRFYVVALLFIVFDVEVAFFFPWATIYGGAMQLVDGRIEGATRLDLSQRLLGQEVSEPIGSEAAALLGGAAFLDVLVFFGVLMVGFAYIWKRGDLDWIRAIARRETTPSVSETETEPAEIAA